MRPIFLSILPFSPQVNLAEAALQDAILNVVLNLQQIFKSCKVNRRTANTPKSLVHILVALPRLWFNEKELALFADRFKKLEELLVSEMNVDPPAMSEANNEKG